MCQVDKHVMIQHQGSVALTNAPLASAVQLGALQSIVVTMMIGRVLMVVVVLVLLVLLDNIVSRTSSEKKDSMLIMSQTYNHVAHQTN